MGNTLIKAYIVELFSICKIKSLAYNIKHNRHCVWLITFFGLLYKLFSKSSDGKPIYRIGKLCYHVTILVLLMFMWNGHSQLLCSILFVITSGYPWPSDTVKSLSFFKSYLFIFNWEHAFPGQDVSGGHASPPKGPPLPLCSLV